MAKLIKLHAPSKEQAREFFNWQIEKHPIIGHDGRVLTGWNEFRSSKGNTLHVGNDTYSPAQPGIAYEKTIQALDTLELDYAVSGVGSFDDDKNIFAQFDVGNGEKTLSRYGYKGSEFTVNGKQYQGLVTMAKGNDESVPLSYWLTIICIVCANTFRAALKARKGNKMSVTMRQTKNSGTRLDTIQNEIVALFDVQETVKQTLEAMSQTPVSLSEAEQAFLGLVKPVDGKIDLSKTGKARLENTLERYKQAFQSSPGVNGGNTREDWFNAVTNVDTHGNTDSKRFDADKQFVSSEFGTYADRKSRAFDLASNPESWETLVQTGSDLMNSLLNRPVILATEPDKTFAALLNK